ncbi:hypothetical protein CDAR_62331 [Caerostris darwini]|uniref:Ycf15 n=1 Tax=Caerostris darwini TaxID=1538125 RepID=A0AAV4UF38_9ARAC|nr:hypothetical protein CDAR_62331 [Caerostris darwini]
MRGNWSPISQIYIHTLCPSSDASKNNKGVCSKSDGHVCGKASIHHRLAFPSRGSIILGEGWAVQSSRASSFQAIPSSVPRLDRISMEEMG